MICGRSMHLLNPCKRSLSTTSKKSRCSFYWRAGGRPPLKERVVSSVMRPMMVLRKAKGTRPRRLSRRVVGEKTKDVDDLLGHQNKPQGYMSIWGLVGRASPALSVCRPAPNLWWTGYLHAIDGDYLTLFGKSATNSHRKHVTVRPTAVPYRSSCKRKKRNTHAGSPGPLQASAMI